MRTVTNRVNVTVTDASETGLTGAPKRIVYTPSHYSTGRERGGHATVNGGGLGAISREAGDRIALPGLAPVRVRGGPERRANVGEEATEVSG